MAAVEKLEPQTETAYPLRLRTLVLAIVLAVAGVRLQVYTSMEKPGSASIDFALAVLVVLVLLEPLFEKLLRVGRKDFLYIYAFCMVAIGVYDGVARFMPVYTAAQYFNASDNNYAEIANLYPDWFIPHNTELIRQFYEGATGPVDWSPWVMPVILWTLFLSVLWFTLLCICTLLRRHWVEDERLAFPLLAVPLYVTSMTPERIRTHRGIWREPMMWIGFCVATLHFVSIMIHAANPGVPTLGPSYDVGKFFTEKPLDGLRPYFLFVHNPQLTGLAYFAPQDLCFSMFFFFFMIKGVMLFYRVAGLQEPSGFPFFWEQAAGAFTGIALYYAWAGRDYISGVLRNIWSSVEKRDLRFVDPDAPFSYRFAFVGAIVGYIFLSMWYIAAGMTWWIPFVFFAMIILFATIFTRGRAEAGIGSLASSPFWQASRQIKSFLGTRALVPNGDYTNVAMLGSLIFLHFSNFPQNMTFQIEGLKIAGDANLNKRRMAQMMMFAAVLGIAVLFVMMLSAHYQWGGITLGTATGTSGGYHVSITQRELAEVSDIIDGNHLAPDWNRNGYTLGAMLFTLLLVGIRMRYLRFPLHPLGYVMTTPYGYAYWGPFMLAWGIKWVILRLGGIKLYNNLIPFFIGLIIGQTFSISIIWQAVAHFMSDQWMAMADPLVYF